MISLVVPSAGSEPFPKPLLFFSFSLDSCDLLDDCFVDLIEVLLVALVDELLELVLPLDFVVVLTFV